MTFEDNLIGTKAPEFLGDTWLNSPPLKLDNLLSNGRIVLIDFWTYSCINCLRTIPHLKDLWSKYQQQGLVIIGIHTPEFDFEKSTENIEQAIQDLGIKWPVINDKDYLNWNAYTNSYWPRKLLLDREGKIVYDHIGEGSYEETESVIRKLLGIKLSTHLFDRKLATHRHKVGSFCRPTNPETYLGYNRGHYLNEIDQKLLFDKEQDYRSIKQQLELGILLKGPWVVTKECLSYKQQNKSLTDYLQLNFAATEVNLVLASANEKPCPIMVTLDDKPIPDSIKGTDIFVEGKKTFLIVDKPRLYQVIKSKQYLSPVTLKFFPLAPNFRAYAFTFGGCD